MNLQHYCSMNEFASLVGVTPGYIRLLVSRGKILATRHPAFDHKPLILRSLASEWRTPRGGRPRISAPKKNGKKITRGSDFRDDVATLGQARRNTSFPTYERA